MPKNNKPFVMPGADALDDDFDAPLADLNFVEKTEEEIAAEADKAAARAALVKEDEKEEDKGEKKTEEKAETKTEEELAAEEVEAAAELEKTRLAAEGKKKQPMIPKSRLDEVLAKNKLLEKERDEARAAAAGPKPDKEPEAFDFKAKEKEYMQAVRDGEDEKALEIRDAIRAAERAELTTASREDSVEVDDRTAMAKAAAEIEENFPQFVKGHADFNQEATDRVVKMRNALIASGSSMVAALNEAVEFVVNKYGFDKPLEEATKKDDPKVVNLDEKRKKDVAKKVDLQKKQPPEMEGEGERTRTQSEVDLDEMTEEEFNALPEATKKRMRGDLI